MKLKMRKIIYNLIADMVFHVGRFILCIGDYIIGISCKLHIRWKTDTGIILKNMENYIKSIESYLRDRTSCIINDSLKNSKEKTNNVSENKKINGKIIKFRKKDTTENNSE